MSINTKRITDLAKDSAPLYLHHHWQSNAQPAYIELGEDGDVSAGFSGEIGDASPMRVWHGCDRRYSVPSNLSGAGVVALVERLRPLLERVHAGHSVEWDGNNLRGALNEDACAAEAEIKLDLQDVEGDVDVWDVSDWLFSGNSLNHLWDHETSLADAVARLEAEAQANNVVLAGDIKTALLNEAGRIWERDEKSTELGPKHIEALFVDGRIIVTHDNEPPADVTAP